ncbi:[LSU ribosomal protein L11P]-lysine N-methyltransferase [Acetitomaculum ruminis DSM 5522]|uniref:Ribosomal protein L11 methyltransferase n=1 Tax=Acetitomaculum ruminis DSM 5522 TaxID=1120918 RepID=A0A1I0ZFR5_9FIRM|nr:50S ribosomal protein L11 methyltransferase [Acetitomaculum ruminis]SFB24649.1 [LSU ribosomal protein L11P]-lysine N-methyltransferase [Acetitomaculum ruminis DSM 5522]
MKWNKYRIKTKAMAEDILCGMLMELGIDSFEVEDNIPISSEDVKALYIDIPAKLDSTDDTAYISFYTQPDDANEKQLIENVLSEIERLREFADLGEGSIEKFITDEEDYINEWKQYFKPFYIEDILIKPSWEKVNEIKENSKIIEIDPGTAFGTGKHETTRLCIEGIKKYVKNDSNVLDIGCGSGILSIAAIKCGAKKVLGTDIDEIAVKASYENIKVNNISTDECSFETGNVLEDNQTFDEENSGKYDIVVANIFANIIIPMSKKVSKYMTDDGVFISSGIILSQEDRVKNAFKENGLRVIEVNRINDWVCIVAKKAGV